MLGVFLDPMGRLVTGPVWLSSRLKPEGGSRRCYHEQLSGELVVIKIVMSLKFQSAGVTI